MASTLSSSMLSLFLVLSFYSLYQCERSFDEVFDVNEAAGPLRVLSPPQDAILPMDESLEFSFSVVYDPSLVHHRVRMTSLGNDILKVDCAQVWSAPSFSIVSGSAVEPATSQVRLQLIDPSGMVVADHTTWFTYVSDMSHFQRVYNFFVDTSQWALLSNTSHPFWMTFGSPAFCFASRMITSSRMWEPVKTKLVSHLLSVAEGKKTLLDLGSNMGWYALLASSMGHKAIAFEPLKENYSKIKLSRLLNGFGDRLTVHEMAASNTTGEAAIFSSIELNQFNGEVAIEFDQEGKKFDEDKTFRQLVKLARVDDYVKEEIYIMKVDVEAHEPQAFEGAANLLNDFCVPYIFVEYSPTWLEEMGSDPKAMLDSLLSLGYTITKEADWGMFLHGEADFDTTFASVTHLDTYESLDDLYVDPELYPRWGTKQNLAKPQTDLFLVRDCGDSVARREDL